MLNNRNYLLNTPFLWASVYRYYNYFLVLQCGALAIGIQLSQLHCLHQKYRKRDDTCRCPCLWYKVVYALPGIISHTSSSFKKNVLQTDKKKNEDTTTEDIFEFTLHRIEQELLEELEKKTRVLSKGPGSTSFIQKTSSSDHPEWTKLIYPSQTYSSPSVETQCQKFHSDKTLLQNLDKELLRKETEQNCLYVNQNLDQYFSVTDTTQQTSSCQALRDSIHWLPNGFSLPQPIYQTDVLHNYNVFKNRQKEKIKPRETTAVIPESKKGTKVLDIQIKL